MNNEEFLELAKKAFSENPDEAFESSIELARKTGVPEDKILKTKEEIDILFTK